jgi:hypothetical protein
LLFLAKAIEGVAKVISGIIGFVQSNINVFKTLAIVVGALAAVLTRRLDYKFSSSARRLQFNRVATLLFMRESQRWLQRRYRGYD